MLVPVLVSLVVGVVAGWLGQRSRFCSIGGLRDFLLARDTSLLLGIVALFAAAWLANPLIDLVRASGPPQLVEQTTPSASNTSIDPLLVQKPAEGFRWPPFSGIIFLGAVGVGFVSVLAGGCPFRMHILAGQGVRDAMFYLAGFYLAGLVFEYWSTPLLRLFAR